MNEFEKNKLRIKLIEIYESYVRDADDSEARKKARELFFEYIYMSEALDKEFVNAVTGLEHIGWEFSRSTKTAEHDWKMKKEDAQEILQKISY